MKRHIRGKALGHKPGRMNKLEKAYSVLLDERIKAGEVASWRFESLKFRLADRTWYTPDFVVLLKDGTVECHEVKGFWQDAGRIKWKVAAETYPEYQWVAVQRQAKKRGGGWKVERA